MCITMKIIYNNNNNIEAAEAAARATLGHLVSRARVPEGCCIGRNNVVMRSNYIK